MKCPRCKGIGKVPDPPQFCNCGSGEGCGVHDEIAIGLWGQKCPDCEGSGKIPDKKTT